MSHLITCDTCKAQFDNDDVRRDDSGDYCLPCYDAWMRQSALDAGIPLSVIEGRTKLTDHFSEDYINWKAGHKPNGDI